MLSATTTGNCLILFRCCSFGFYSETFWNSRNVSVGAGEIENAVDRQALIIMVVTISESWKIPITYFLISGGTKRANVWMDHQLGAKLDITNMTPYFLHPEDQTQKVHVLLDTCHMLKLIKNVFFYRLSVGDRRWETDQMGVHWRTPQTSIKGKFVTWQQAKNGMHPMGITKNEMKVHLAAQQLMQPIKPSPKVMPGLF